MSYYVFQFYKYRKRDIFYVIYTINYLSYLSPVSDILNPPQYCVSTSTLRLYGTELRPSSSRRVVLVSDLTFSFGTKFFGILSRTRNIYFQQLISRTNLHLRRCLHATVCDAVSLVTVFRSNPLSFPCKISYFRETIATVPGFSHCAIMQILFKSNRGRARYWETGVGEGTSGDWITEEAREEREEQKTDGKRGWKKCERRKELSDNAEGSAELWEVLHLARGGPAFGKPVETQPLKCRDGAAKCQTKPHSTPSDKKTCRVLSPLVCLHESWISIADQPPPLSSVYRLIDIA